MHSKNKSFRLVLKPNSTLSLLSISQARSRRCLCSHSSSNCRSSNSSPLWFTPTPSQVSWRHRPYTIQMGPSGQFLLSWPWSLLCRQLLAFLAASATGATAAKNPSKTTTTTNTTVPNNLGTLSSGLIRKVQLVTQVEMEEAEDTRHSKMLTTSKAEWNLLSVKDTSETVHDNGYRKRSFDLQNFSYLPEWYFHPILRLFFFFDCIFTFPAGTWNM